MNGAISWFARNPVAANLAMALIVVSGLFASTSISQEIFPEMALDMVTVNVTYLGATPAEVEQAVSVRLEEAIQGLDGIRKITSTASEGVASLAVELELGADLRKAVDEIKGGVDAIDTFPAEVERPVVREITTKFQVTHVAVWGDVDELALRRWADRVRDELSSLPGVSQVELLGARPYEISIEVSETALRRHGLTFDRVADAVRVASLDVPGGSVKTDGGEVLIRTVGQVYQGAAFESLALLTSADGTYVRLGDVATVVDGFAETDQASRFNGVPTIVLQVFRSNQSDAPDVAAAVQQYVERAPAFLPPGVALTVWQDQATLLEHRLGLMVRNGLTGSLLVFGFLAVFLQPRLAFWVGLGVPVSFLGAFMLMPSLDLSLNMMTLFGFLVVLGIVVDDAIIVGENIHTHQERHGDMLRGAIEGAREVAIPVTFGVLTTVAAFVPIMLVEGMMGKFFQAVPLVVTCCLVFSLIESTLILPAHLAHSRRGHSGGTTKTTPASGRRLRWLTTAVYGPVLDASIRWRYLTVAAGLATLLLTVGTLSSGRVPFEFFAAPESDYVTADIALAPGAPIQMTRDVVSRLEASANQLAAQYRADESGARIRHVYAAVGEQPFGSAQAEAMMSGGAALGASHVGEVTIEIESGPERALSGDEIAAHWRDLIGPLPDVEDLSFLASSFSPGQDLDIQLTGSDLATLESAAVELQDHLGRYPGVYDVNDSARPGKQELRMQIKPSATLLGLSQRDLGRQVRQAFYGEEVQRIQRGRHDIRVMVRYPSEGRRSVGDVDQMRIRTPAGAEVPFTSVADVETGRGFSTIRRVDRDRAVNVTAAVGAATSANSVMSELEADVLPTILATHPGVGYSLAGMLAEQQDSLGGLLQGFIVALLLIYTLLAIPLRSYVQPFIIMAAIPFGLVGAFWGHVIMGVPLTLISLFGVVALAGVVVNDSLLMVDFINRKRVDAGSLAAAAREAGLARFRPILLTSLTTFAGLLPIIIDNDIQARSLVPMAISLAFGVVFATVITLILVPAGYVIVEDGRRLLSGKTDGTDATSQPTLSPQT